MVEPTIPFHLARAYGVQPARPVAPVQPVRATGHSDGSSPSVSVDPATRAGAEIRERLVAAVVPGRVDFSGTEPTQTMSLYRHPADRNAAATGVHAGRVIDVTG